MYLSISLLLDPVVICNAVVVFFDRYRYRIGNQSVH